MTFAFNKICVALAIMMTTATLYAGNKTSQNYQPCQSCPSPCGYNTCPSPCCPPPCNQGPYCCGPNCLPPPYCYEFNVFGELIYWIADLGGLESAFGNTTVVTTVNPVTSFTTTTITESDVQPKFKWRPGFRVGADFAFGCFVLEADWTHYRGRAHFSEDNQSGHWKINYDTLDLVIGRRTCTAPCFYLKPYIGARGLRVHQILKSDLDTEFVAGAVGTNTVVTTKKDSEHIWGIGPELGLEADWYLKCNFSLYANFDVVAYYGTINGKYLQTDTFPTTASVSDAHNHFHFNKIGTDIALGIRYDKAWPVCSEALLTCKLGIEQHRIYDFSNIASDGTLSLDGPVFRLSLGYRY